MEQGIFIVETLSSPCSINEESYTYMLHVNIQRIKALILEKAVLYEVMGGEHNIVPINMPGLYIFYLLVYILSWIYIKKLKY